MNIHEETLKIARNLIKKDPSLTDWVISKFPELKESEDDSVIKWIINEIRDNMNHEPLSEYKKKAEKAIAWLEKQGEQKNIEGTFINVDEVRENFVKEIYRVLANDTTNDRANDIIYYFDSLPTIYFDTNKPLPPDDLIEESYQQQADDLIDMVTEKPVDKVEPKFHKGEWIVWQNKLYKVNDNGCGYELIDQKGLRTSLEYGTVDKSASKFTIQDAKDGDVLATSNYIYIFNSIDKETETVAFYCVMKKSDEYFSFGDYRIHDEILNSVPATKEQCDTLIKAMVKAGCEFDFEKKEFKKIEQKSTDMIESTPHNYITPNKQFFQWIYDRLIYVHNENPNVDYMLSLKERIENMQKPTWSEEDEKMLDTLIADYEFLSKKYRDQEHDFFVEISLAKDDLDMISWFKSLKDRVCCEANCTTTKEWSEEDKAIFDRANVWLNNLCDYLKNCSSDCIHSEIKNIIKKLESFKERCIWKPSDEQMKVLYKYAEQNNYDGTILTSLYNDLKQL